MFQFQFLGTLGADAEKKYATDSGRKFTTFRAAHNDVWRDENGVEHSNTIWVDCIMDDHPAVVDYLKRGTQVFITGRRFPSLRVYSSPKDRCMKAGMTLKVSHIELLGGRVDAVPRELIDGQGALHVVNKFYHIDGIQDATTYVDKRGNQYAIDKNGWVSPVVVDVNSTKEVEDNAPF